MRSLSPDQGLSTEQLQGSMECYGLSAVGPDGPPMHVTCELWRTHVSYRLVFLIPRPDWQETSW